jgi:hypothetical protein
VTGLQQTLNALSFDPLLAQLFASTPDAQLARLATSLATADPYGERAALAEALTLASADPDTRAHLEHRLWCARRQAAWTTGLARPLPCRLEGASWLRETAGHPTILVTPMTLAPSDGLRVIARLNPGRDAIVYGEAAPDDLGGGDGLPEVVSGGGSPALRRILEVLRGGGVMCTYPDFVYDGHAAAPIVLFGTRRAVSAGFLSLAARDDTMLLPLICVRAGEEVVVHVNEPLRVEIGDGPTDRALQRAAVAAAVAEMLEELIAVAPAQWLLLPTLTFRSPQMAVA